MTQVSARLPVDLVEQLDKAARRLKRSRATVIRLAIECFLDDAEDLRLGLERLRDPSDPILDWEEVKRDTRFGLRAALQGPETNRQA